MSPAEAAIYTDAAVWLAAVTADTAPVLPAAEDVAAHLAADGRWLVAYRGGGVVRFYEGGASQADDARELLASGTSLRWWALPAEVASC